MRATSVASAAAENRAATVSRGTQSLRSNVYWTLIGNIVFTACQAGAFICIARVGSAGMVGQFALAAAVVTPIVILSNMALRELQATDAKFNYPFQSYLAVRISTTAIAMMVTVGLAYLWNYRADTAMIIIAAGLIKGVDSISDIIQGYLQQHDSFDLVAIFRSVAALSSLATIIGGLAITGSLVSTMNLLVLISLLRLLLWEVPVIRARHREDFHCWPEWNKQHLRELIAMTAPLGIVSMIISLNGNLPRYVIEHYLGGAFTDGMGKAAAPRLSRLFADGQRREYFQLLGRMGALGGLVGGVAVFVSAVFGREILALVYSPQFAAHSRLLPWIMLAACVNYVGGFVGIGLVASRHFRVMPILGIAALASQGAASMLLIPAWGLMGAAWSLLICSICSLVASIFCLSLLPRQTIVHQQS